MNNSPEKMSLDEYQQSNEHSKEIKSAKGFLYVVAVAVGIAIVFYLFSIVAKLFEINDMAGYIGIAGAIIVFLFLYIIPVVKVYKTNAFMTKVHSGNARKAKKINKKLREELADRIIDSVSKVDDLNWYSDDHIKRLAIARHTKNDGELKQVMTEIYSSDVKKSADKIIEKCAVQVGLATALSQSNMMDSLLVIIFELKLIKDIVYLYGYRPSDTQMLKIMKNVLRNSLLVYGISVTSDGIAQLVNKAVSAIPVLNVIVSSGFQGLANGAFAAMLGVQTKKYLIKEYKLQDMLDNVHLDTSVEEDEKLISEAANAVKKSVQKGKNNSYIKPQKA